MARRRRDPEREQVWRQRFSRWQSSGLSVRAFCAAEGIPESAWYFWRGELRRRRSVTTTPHPAFVPVTVLPAAISAIEVRCPSGHVITLPGSDAATLRVLFAALAVPAPC